MKSYQCAYFLIVLTLLLAGLPGYARALDENDLFKQDKFKRRVETGLRLSADRHIGTTEIWAPFYQEQDRVLYGDMRVMGDNLSNFEGNLGLGYRQMVDDKIYGGFGFIDHRVTALGSDIWQATFGAEYLKSDWEARANIYLPLDGAKTYAVDVPSGPYLAGNGIFVRGPSELIEEAQAGLDAEIGFRLPQTYDFFQRAGLYDTARAFGGFYYFRGDQTPDVVGGRARLQFDINPFIQAGARAQYDAERGEQYFLELTMRFPGVQRERDQGLRARLAASPERDVDIVTGSVLNEGRPQQVMDLTTGDAASIIYVNNAVAAGGNGTFEAPYNHLSDAVAVAQANDTVYIFAGTGGTAGYDTGLNLTTPDVTIMGAGSPLYFDGTRFAAPDGFDYDFTLLLPAGDYPMITNPGGAGATIAANNITLRGFQIDDAQSSGVYVSSGVEDTVIDNMRLTGNGGLGLEVDNNGATAMGLRMRETAITGNNLGGIATNVTGAGTIALDLGTAADYGFNDIYGNLGVEIYANTGAQAINARGNYWAADVADISGPNAGQVDQATTSGAAFCDNCGITTTAFVDQTSAVEGSAITSNVLTLSGFKGHRYIMTTTANSPELVVNGANIHATTAKVTAGDTVAIAMNTPVAGLATRTATLFAGDFSDTWSVQTRFLPNSLNHLIAWWDGADIDGDFDTADNPTNGSLISSWTDKTGFGHTASAAGSLRPTLLDGGVMADGVDDQMRVANSGYLSSLGGGTTVVMVLRGAPVSGDVSAFAYGTCVAGIGSRCFAVNEAGLSDDALIRVDTSGGNNQNTGATSFTLFDGNTHIIVASAVGGALNTWVDDVNVISAAYSPGTGIGSTAGLLNVGSINGAYYETLLFNGDLDPVDRGLVTTYLKDKWNLN